jgi:hypothetical protein
LEAMPRKISIDSHGTSHKCGKYCNMKLEPWMVEITAGSIEVLGSKGPWQETATTM